MNVERADRDAVLFSNEDWQVLADGLEHRGTGYFIAREALNQRQQEQLWAWPLQMAEKRWCAPRLFREAFLAALDLFGVARDARLGPSFALGYGIRAGAGDETGFVSLGNLVGGKPAARRAAVSPASSGRAGKAAAGA